MSARPIIPRRKLFDNPTFFNAKLSPDGQLLSWLAPVDGVLNVWASPVDSIAAGVVQSRAPRAGLPCATEQGIFECLAVIFLQLFCESDT
jgi:hypothetical protein